MGVVLAYISKCEARAVIVVPNTQVSWFPMIDGAEVRSVQIASQGEDSQFLGYTTNAEQHRTRSAEEACER